MSWGRRGAAVMGLALGACSDSLSGPSGPIIPTQMVRVGAIDDQVTAVGTAVASAPAVLVVDGRGGPVSGAVVSFTVTTGGGSIAGAAQQTTGSDGRATLEEWVVGAEPGENTVTATADGLRPVAFTATGVAALPASVVATAGGAGQRAVAGTAVPTAPAVVVHDSQGNPVPNVTVQFAVVSGYGTVTGAASRTDSAGAAAVESWTLGAIGANSVTATVAGLAPVVFTAEALDPCAVTTPHTVGTTSDGVLRTVDCRLSSGAYVDYFAIDSADHRALSVGQTSESMDSFVILYDHTGSLVAYDDDGDGTTMNASLVALVAPGRYYIGATSYSGKLGPYRVTTQAASAAGVTSCRHVFITRGVTTAQQVQTTDCASERTSSGVVSTYRHDGYLIYLRGGQPVTVDMADPTLDAYLELHDESGRLLATDDSGGGAGTTNARITFTPTLTGFYEISAGTRAENATGNYTLSVR